MMKKNFLRLFVIATALTTGVSAWAHDGDHNYVNGICSIEGCTDPYEAPDQDSEGWFLVANAGNVEWISDYVQNVAIDPKVKMTDDIDFTGVNHIMIGRNDARKFNGVWDGQGHRITNLVLNYGSADTPTAIGFFAWVRGGTTIKNLIMDKTCYFEGKVRVAAFVGVTQVVNGPVRIENCVNEANVQGHTGATGGFIGCRNPNNYETPQNIISGCANHGNILCDANEAGAFVGWANSATSEKHIVENSYNTGKISVDGNKRGFIRGDNLQITNSYDFGENANNNNQKASYEWATSNPVASGELAYIINDKAGSQVFYQNLESNVEAAPVPFSTSGQVYAHGNYRCDGVALPGTYYDNTYSEGEMIPPHNYNDNGLCQNEGCTKPFQAPEVDTDGWTLLANVGNVEWLSDKVATSGGGYVAKAKLVADIDFENKVNLHSPIGPSTGAKFKGEFDGQGHRIKNMIINQPDKEAQGFFGWLQGNSNTYIHDLIIDSSCSIKAANKAGGLAGASQNYNENATIHIENVVTGASVTVTGQDAAGIVGGENGNKANFLVRNCVNTGTITSTHQNPYVGALFCYQERGTVKNFINLGTINGHLGGNIGRFNGGQLINVVDLSDTEDKTQAVVESLTTDDIASGKLAFYMNEQAGEEVFFQTLGTDEHPMPFNTSNAVYGTAWDGTNTVYYNNVSGMVTASKVTINDQCQTFALPTGATSATAQKVAYSRSNVAGFNTVCLPVALTADMLPTGVKIYTLGDIEENSIKVNEVTEVAAGVPCLVEFPTDYTDNWDIAINAVTALAIEPVNAATLKGSYISETIGADKYKLNSTGTAFGKTTAAATIKPFRAYVEAASAAKELTLNFGDETGIEAIYPSPALPEGEGVVYDLQGRKVSPSGAKILIVKMANGETRKVVVK